MPSNLVSGDLDVKSESDVVDDGDENYQAPAHALLTFEQIRDQNSHEWWYDGEDCYGNNEDGTSRVHNQT
ncbi:predicted protein [Botrytis cinerea T4]|uniref:Uncharacterized protein n=1 Tax=Botryotinia fuckeliana (strain T4) TaxID=999810 RepID=G2XSZ5_BOTF4|nr:predicted protein [Botrytis cinerea T4]